MGKRAMEMKVIENRKSRERVFEKRRNNLLKKAKELSILCDSKILIIIFELDKPKPEIWPGDAEEAAEIINRFKQQRARKACDSSAASKKKELGEKFSISDHKSVINQWSENQLQELCHELDAKIGAVMNAIKSKEVMSESPRPMMSAADDCQGIGLILNQGKGKEVDTIQQDQSFDMLYHTPNFLENPMMVMLQNGIGYLYPQFDGSSSTSSNIPYVHYVDPSLMQPVYMTADSLMGYYKPIIHHIPPGVYYPMMPAGFPSYDMNASD